MFFPHPIARRRALMALLLIGLINPLQAQSTPPDDPAPLRFVLSFDDGPSGTDYLNPTELVLDTLAQNDVQPGIKAIFFIQTRANRGGGTPTGQALLQREQREGHVLAFHTATPGHANHRHLSDAALEQSLLDGVSDLRAITGRAPTLVRPPFWNYDARTFAAYRQHDLRMLLTDLSANDGKIWGVNFSLTRRSNMLRQLGELRARWQAGDMPVVDGATPVVVTFHDVNSYTARHTEEYLHILLDSAQQLSMPVTTKPFYDDAAALERAALARTVERGDTEQQLPGFWNWWWH